MDYTNLIKELEIDKLPEAEQQEVLQNVLQTVSMRVSLRLGRELSEDQLKALEAASEKGDDAALDEMNRMYPGYNQMYQEEIDKLKDEMLSL